MHGGIQFLTEVPRMSPQLLPATARDDVPAWQQSVVAFLAEKERRSGSHRTVKSYARMLWPFLSRIGSPDLIRPPTCSLRRTELERPVGSRRRRRSAPGSPV